MRPHLSHCCCAVSAAVSIAVAAGFLDPGAVLGQADGFVADGFVAPDFETELFDIDSVFLEPGEQQRATAALAALAANFPDEPKVTRALQARALALALRIDGVHRAATATLADLMAGEPPEPVPGFEIPAAAAATLWDIAEALDVSDAGEDDFLLACYLMDIAARIDPDRPGGLERFQKLSLKGGYSGWKGVINGSRRPDFQFPRQPDRDGGTRPPRDPDGPPDGGPPDLTPPDTPDPQPPPARLVRTEAVARLLAVDPRKGRVGGTVLPVQATAIVGALDAPMKVKFRNADGDPIPNLAMASAYVPVAVEASGLGWPRNGGSITVAVGDRYDPGNGQGIALVAALLARCMVEDREVDMGAAVVGGLGEGGAVVGLRDPLALLRRLDRGAAPVVVLPAANLPQLRDLAVMGDLSAFVDHQIFAVRDLAAACSVAIPGDEPVERARALFAEVQDLADTMPPGDLAANSKVQERLSDIVALAPSHASARVLLAAGRGELPAKLTLKGSIHLLERAAAPVLAALGDGGDPYVADAAAAFGASVSTLRGARAKLHPDSVRAAGLLKSLTSKLVEYSSLADRASPRAEAMEEEIRDLWLDLKLAHRELGRPPGVGDVGGGGSAGGHPRNNQ